MNHPRKSMATSENAIYKRFANGESPLSDRLDSPEGQVGEMPIKLQVVISDNTHAKYKYLLRGNLQLN
jgi:hypothetical protein